MIFQQSLDSGVIPEDWKQANVVAIFKKGDKHLPSNYRPVSLTCVTCKILEHVVFRSIMDHLDLNNILVHFQHGFRSQHSCETQLINTIEDLAKGIGDRKQLDLLILDFSKAFDKVSHRHLLSKLDFYGIKGDTLMWIGQWLTGRTQQVIVDGESSPKSHVRSGVPQGTVLGPLMFLIYINDIGLGINSSVRLFADDSLVYRVVESELDAAALQCDLDRLCGWARDWHMVFNPAKCYVLSITNKSVPIRSVYTMFGHQLEQVEHHPYLGVELSKNLDWGPHINSIMPKAQRSLNFLRRNLHGCSIGTKDKAYRSLVRPILEYGAAAWDPYHSAHISRIESVQRRAARFVNGTQPTDRDSSVTNMINALGWRTLQERRLVARLTMMYKAVNLQTACYIPTYFQPVVAGRRASHGQQYSSPHVRVDVYKFSYFPRTFRSWNILPESAVISPDVDTFKAAVQGLLQSGIMYVVPPKGTYSRPRLGSTGTVSVVGPVY